MGFDIEGHKFIVTGAAKGIGFAISKRLSELGAEISGWDLDTSTIISNPVFSHTLEVNITDEKNIKSATKETISFLGGLEGLIANAGINGPTKNVWDYSLKEWEQVIKVDLTGAFLTTKAVLNHLRKKGYGRLIIVSSVAGKEGNPGAAAYGAAKAGIIGYAKGLAQELLPSNITVNCLAPAITETDLMNEMTDVYIQEKKSRIPMGRFCSTSEIADMTAWVASPYCSFTTGQIFDLSGGRATY